MVSKLLLLVIIIIGISMATDVLQVKVFPEKITSGALFESGRVTAVSTKRLFEMYSAQNDAQRLEVVLGFVRQDAARLEKLISTKPNIEKLVPQTELLKKSVTKARELTKVVSEGELAEMQGLSDEAFELASNSLTTLVAFQQDLQTSSNQLTEVLEEVDVPTNKGEVAGVSDTGDVDSEEPAPTNTAIPLQF